jgi:hypothetical protein
VPTGAGWFHEIKQFVIDGEAVILGVDGIADFNTLSGKQNAEVQLCAFDVLAVDGEHIRDLPLSMRKANLDRLLRGRPDGIFVNPFEIGAVGPDLFRAACVMGLEGLVSKRSDRPYRAITPLDQGEEPCATGQGGLQRMSAMARLLERKSQLLALLQQDPGPEEREQVGRLLEQINAALDSLEEAGSGTSD